MSKRGIAGGVFALCLLVAGCGGGGDGPTGNRTIAAVEIVAGKATLLVGETSQLTATAVDAGGVAIPGAGAVTWSSAGLNVATVTPTGLVQAVGNGSATISARIQNVTGFQLITVLPPGAGAVVTMPGNSFIPFQVNIRVNQSVYFEFPSVAHNVIFGTKAGAPADIPVTSRQTVARTFTVAGQFAYDCTLHPGMSGVVAVSP